jgi:ribosome-associated translation inhibitor RaiA
VTSLDFEWPTVDAQFAWDAVHLADLLRHRFLGEQMKIQVNSDKTINVDAKLTSTIEGEANRVLNRFEKKLTRVEVHLSDVDNKKAGRADKRCLIEVRPAGDRPLTASAKAATTESAVSEALGKMQRSLTTFFARKGRPAEEVSAPVSTVEKSTANKTVVSAKKSAPPKKAAAKKPTKLSPRGPKKKGIFQARRKSQPSR